jgi:HK97 family phage prohead protease
MSEIRALATDLEMRGMPGAGAQLMGYASRFNVETVIGDVFREQVAPRAFHKTLKERDVRAFADHDSGRVVGRSKGGPHNLTLTEDADGLYTVLDVPDTPTARSLYADIQAGLIDGMSFSFDPVNENGKWWAYPEGQLPLRTLREVKLYEVSYVALPAYETTSVEARSLLVATVNLWTPKTEEERDAIPSSIDVTTQEPESEPGDHSEFTQEPEPMYRLLIGV